LLKKEARILGISTPIKELHRAPLIGVVFRGNLWLDGLTTCWLRPRGNHLIQLTQAILQTKQYSQIHAVIFSREKLTPYVRIDLADLSRRIRLPVIAIVKKNKSRKRNALRVKPSIRHATETENFDIEVNGRSISVKAVGINREATRELFEVTCADNCGIPEAVRIADLIAKHVSSRILFRRSK
jgi:endonuclease V-like protein UPF0215 family